MASPPLSTPTNVGAEDVDADDMGGGEGEDGKGVEGEGDDGEGLGPQAQVRGSLHRGQGTGDRAAEGEGCGASSMPQCARRHCRA